MKRVKTDEADLRHISSEAPASRARRGTGRRLHGAIANKLGRAIVGGEYAPGDRLEGEVAFSESLDVSRTAYREAIQVLVAKGLVESKPKAGTRVLPRARWNLLDPEVLAWAFSGQPHMNFVRDLFELRSVIEPAAARFAAERRDKSDLKAMRDALASMRHHSLATDAGQTADRDFHHAILHATRNDAIVALSASIGAAVSWTTVFKQRGEPLPRNAIPDHVRVYEAIAAGDADAAAEAMRALVALALQDTRSSME
ncbi:FadR/GntR family transcriptional regulator [Sphingomonas sp.]|uniref:FadR/GntR family transcriptional regulator n=1 Tax=Sphingomonas sp. TaxID=28214 RepID=UPI000DB21AD2|nr:FadR/GntR family transcriptional regulator [Sphingomonas sp.]PZU09258.1 MAG: GntR family transcriptional regulator [Sphingomonas sp.]